VHLRGIHKLNMHSCKGITDAALAQLHGIHTLNMDCCSGITGAGFVHLLGIHTLDMGNAGASLTLPLRTCAAFRS
jgi:hypothetical protein